VLRGARCRRPLTPATNSSDPIRHHFPDFFQGLSSPGDREHRRRSSGRGVSSGAGHGAGEGYHCQPAPSQHPRTTTALARSRRSERRRPHRARRDASLRSSHPARKEATSSDSRRPLMHAELSALSERISMHAAAYSLVSFRPHRTSSRSIFHHSDRKSFLCSGK
jgi:hypothetical protein